jgi:hypothetical protein
MDRGLTGLLMETIRAGRNYETAQAACKQLDELYPLTAPGGSGCVKGAVDESMAQARAAIAAAAK